MGVRRKAVAVEIDDALVFACRFLAQRLVGAENYAETLETQHRKMTCDLVFLCYTCYICLSYSAYS